jgi:hypothetical protein
MNDYCEFSLASFHVFNTCLLRYWYIKYLTVYKWILGLLHLCLAFTVFTVKKEYESEGEKEQRRKIVQLGPRKFEGIGPMTKEGIPIVLRSVSSCVKTEVSSVAKIVAD